MGIDPGTATTGFGAIKKKGKALKCLEYGAIITPKTKTQGERLALIEQDLLGIIERHKPDLMVIERLYFAKNLTTAMPVAEARGVILLCAAKKKVEVKELTPLQVKAAITGYGRAEKKQVQRMVQQLLGLSSLPRPDDAADALGLAIVGSLGFGG